VRPPPSFHIVHQMHVGVVVPSLCPFLFLTDASSIPTEWKLLEVLSFRRLLNDWEIVRVTEFFKVLEIFKGTTDDEDFMFWNNYVRRDTQLIQHTTY